MENDPVAPARGSATSAAYDPKRRRRCAATPARLPRWGSRALPAHSKI